MRSARLPPAARIVTEPPAFSIAAACAPSTHRRDRSLALSSPLPRRRTPSLPPRAQPAALSDVHRSRALASSLPASIAFWTRPRFTSARSLAKMLLKPRFGMRMWSGIWPPSKPLTETPERAFSPFWPRPAVLPLPEPMPRPTRIRALRAPALSRNVEFHVLHSLPRCPSTTGTRCAPWQSCHAPPGSSSSATRLHLVEAKADRASAAGAGAADRRTDLLDLDLAP